MEDASCDVVLISGFLGAGKTTFLRNVLNWPGDLSRTAVIVNEFGRVGVDGDLLRGSDAPVVELANGCICCSMRGELIETLTTLLENFSPKRLLIEATGVADPSDILAVLSLPQFHKRITETSVVTIVEADFWNSREELGTFIDDQIKASDLVLLNKVDLLAPQAVPEILLEIKEICHSCPVIPTHYCQIEPEILWGLRKSDSLKEPTVHFHDHSMSEEAHNMGYVSFSFEEEASFHEKCFRRLMASLPVNLYRVKGYILLGTRRFFINHVGGKTEWVESDKKRQTKLTFVGWSVNEQEIAAKLKDCMTV